MRVRAVMIEEEQYLALEKFAEESEGIAPVSVESLVGMALDAFIAGAMG